MLDGRSENARDRGIVMFDLIVGSAQAYQQVGLFIGALICFGLGALILGYAVYWQLHALRATGTIVGVVADGGMYAPVYRYTSPDGVSHEAKSTISSGSASGKETGRVVPLLVSPHNPAQAQEAGIRSLETVFIVIGVLMALAGVWMGYTAVAAYPVTPMTWIMAAGMLIYGGWHLRRSFIPRGQRLSLADWRKQHNLGATLDPAQVKPIEQIVPAAEAEQAAAQKSQQARKWAPVVGLFAFILLGVAIYQGANIARLEASGLRAQGQVVSLKSEYSSGSSGGSTIYYPIVRYRTGTNVPVEFKDSIGSNPPSYRAGDKVTVLYLADNPSKQAIIDRGVFWNWAIPVLLFIAAGLLFWLFVTMLRSVRNSKVTSPVSNPIRIAV